MNKYISYNKNIKAQTLNNVFELKNQSEYIQSNAKANSCFINEIMNTYKADLEKKKSDGKRRYKDDITYEYLCNLFNIENLDQNIGLTINESLAFFMKYSIGLRVVDIKNSISFEYIPESLNQNVRTQVLYILCHNNHIFKLNNDLMSFRQIKDKTEHITPSNKFLLPNDNKYPVDINTHVIESIESLLDVIKNAKSNEKNCIYCIYNGDLNTALFTLMDNKITPYISVSNKIISGLTLVIENLTIKITPCNFHNTDDTMLNIEDRDTVLNFWKAYNDFSCGLLCYDHLSYHNEEVERIEDTYSIKPILGYIDSDVYDCVGLDESKAYTKKLYDMDMFPVFNYFDIFVPYNGHEIEKYTQYIVKVNDNTVETKILFGKTYSRCYGNKLIEIKGINFEILYFRRPSRLATANGKALINALYKLKISQDQHENTLLLKNTANYVIGMTQKKYNRIERSEVFNSYDEAQHYVIKYGGRVVPIVQNDQKLWIHILKTESKLINGFRPIGDYIYDAQMLTMYLRYKECLQKGLKPIAIKTDCILLDNTEEQLRKCFKFEKKIGGYKLELGKINCSTKLEFEYNKLIHIDEYKTTHFEIKNEYDTNEIKNVLDNNNNVFIQGLYAGVGKTTAIKNACKNVLFVTPFNKLSQELRKDGCMSITLNVLLGVYGDVQEYASNMRKFDTEGYDIICFDEICIYNATQLRAIHNFMLQHTDKKFFATGDTQQLSPLGNNLTNIPKQEMTSYYQKCHDIIFPNRIILQENKRLKSEEDKQKMKLLKADIFDPKQKIMDVFRKHGLKIINNMSQVTTRKNICFFKYRCNMVNSHIYKQVEKPKKLTQIHYNKYYVGQTIVCTQHYKVGTKKLFTNYEYIITEIKDKSFVVHEPNDDINIEIPNGKIEIFRLPYAFTAHSVQGLSFDEPITIFDTNNCYTDRNFVYVALTRARDLNNVYIYEHSEAEVGKLSDCKLEQYFKFKIETYKIQDKKAKREYNINDYITLDWMVKTYHANRYCSTCQEPFMLGVANGTVETNLTVDRLNNEKSHTKDNCRLTCLHCNCTKASHYNS